MGGKDDVGQLPLTETRRAARGAVPLHEEVVTWLRDRIIDGELEPGSRVPERLVCEKLGISRTPLREAYKILAAEHLLILLPNRGAVVPQLLLKDVEDAIQMMAALEALAGESLCARVTDEEVAHIRLLHDAMVGHYENRQLMDYFKTNQLIHASIVRMADNPILEQTYSALVTRFRRFRYAGNRSEDRWRRAVGEHELILSAIEDRDASLLGHLLRAHVRNGWKVVKDLHRDELISKK